MARLTYAQEAARWNLPYGASAHGEWYVAAGGIGYNSHMRCACRIDCAKPANHTFRTKAEAVAYCEGHMARHAHEEQVRGFVVDTRTGEIVREQAKVWLTPAQLQCYCDFVNARLAHVVMTSQEDWDRVEAEDERLTAQWLEANKGYATAGMVAYLRGEHLR